MDADMAATMDADVAAQLQAHFVMGLAHVTQKIAISAQKAYQLFSPCIKLQHVLENHSIYSESISGYIVLRKYLKLHSQAHQNS